MDANARDVVALQHRCGVLKMMRTWLSDEAAFDAVHLAVQNLSYYLPDQDDDGAILPSGTFLLHPRSFVIIGSLTQLTGASGGPIPDKFRSFELFRRSLHEPEVITFDELLSRAEWHVQVAEKQAESVDSDDDILGLEADENGVILDDDWTF